MYSDIIPYLSSLKTKKGVDLEVITPIAHGSTCALFLVKYAGEEKVLKWYSAKRFFYNYSSLYKRMEVKAQRGKIHGAFLSVFDITEAMDDGSFGVIIDKKPKNCYAFTDFLRTEVDFKSYKARVNAALNIINAFNILYSNGYVYLDVHCDSFFINPENGDVVITDNDSIYPCAEKKIIYGTDRFLSPEEMLHESLTDINCSHYSIAIILFMIFCQAHPLEGKGLPSVLTDPKASREYYAKKAFFVFDRDDDSNALDKRIHPGCTEIWESLPDYIKELFYKTFEKNQGRCRPDDRATFTQWLLALARFRSDFVTCSCGNEIIVQNCEAEKCEVCGKKPEIPFKLCLPDYDLPCVPGTRIYRCQLAHGSFSEALQPIAQVIQHPEDPNRHGIVNLSDGTWTAVLPSSARKAVAPKSVVPIKDGIDLGHLYSSFTIAANTKSESAQQDAE